MSDMTRDFCARCGIKHLAQARALMKEVHKGYPHHVWYAMGHMAEAEDEIIERMPKEAEYIRRERLALEKSLNEEGAVKVVYIPGFKDLMTMVAQGALLPEIAEEKGETYE